MVFLLIEPVHYVVLFLIEIKLKYQNAPDFSLNL